MKLKELDKDMEKLFEEGVNKFQYGIEHDQKKLSECLLENEYSRMTLVSELGVHGKYNSAIRKFLESEYCTAEVANNLLECVKRGIDVFLSRNHPTQTDMSCLYDLVHAQGVITLYCQDKLQ